MLERDEETFAALKEMAEDIHLVSRNDNDELIGIEYYNKLHLLSHEELLELEQLWQRKKITCHKEKLASQWLLVQVFALIGFAIYIAWLSGGMTGVIASVFGVSAMIVMMEDKRVSLARRNLTDARQVHARLQQAMESQSTD